MRRLLAKKGLKNSVPTALAAGPWKVTVGSVAVRGGKLTWRDETGASSTQIALANLNLDASSIALPFVASAPMQFKGSLALDPASLAPANAVASTARASQINSSQLNFSGTATDQAAALTANLASWPLNLASKYVG